MPYTVYDMREFYNSRPGRLIRRVIRKSVRELISTTPQARIMGYGYTLPYLKSYKDDCERLFSLMPDTIGIHHWPDGAMNLTGLISEDKLPIETESVDTILVAHGLEYAQHPETLMQELWRVLKSNGRMVLVVPNRIGFWSRADWTPFGHGQPYTLSQLHDLLKRCLFVKEREDHALFVPPFKSFPLLRTFFSLENIGKFCFPALAGVNIVEVSKQVYAPHVKGKGLPAGIRHVAVTDPIPGS